jgi:F-type H+-transporting ATPase subunit b
MVKLNITLLIQLLNFIVALFVLNILLIRPVRGMLRKRRELCDGLTKDAAKFNGEASMRLKKYELELDAVRARAAEQREAIRAQAEEVEQSILESAQNDALSLLQKSGREVEQDMEAARLLLREQVKSMAEKVFARVTG